MALSEDYLLSDDYHPIDLVEDMARNHAWEFDRVTDDQIAMSVEGQWRTYSLTLAWNDQEEVLRLLCTFEMDPPANRMAELFEVMNQCNDLSWNGGFTWWPDARLMVWRYGLCLAGGQTANFDQIDRMVSTAVLAAERFYPAFQLTLWAQKTPAEAMKVAIAEAYGRA